MGFLWIFQITDGDNDGPNISVSWGGQTNLPVSGELMQLRFLLNNASLYSFMAGDANGDGRVDADDVAVLASNWQMLTGAVWGHGDFNDDGAVNDIDATLLAANWLFGVDDGAAVPEPGVIWMLLDGLGALLLVRLFGFRL